MKNRLKLNKQSVLILITIVLTTVGVFMNMFTSLRWQGAPGLTFGNVFFTWIPMVIADILVEAYGKRKSIAIPALAYFVQGAFFLLAVVLVAWHPDFLIWKTTADGVEIFPVVFSDTFRVWLGSVVANYAGIFTNILLMLVLKKHMTKSNKWYSLLFRAVVSTFFGQFVDNAVFMALGLGMWDWVSIGLRQLTEVGMEIVFFPLVLFLIKTVNKLPEGGSYGQAEQ